LTGHEAEKLGIVMKAKHLVYIVCGSQKPSLTLLDKGKKAIPLQAWTGPEGSKRLRFPDFKTIGTLRWQVLSALCTGGLYPQKIYLVLISATG